MFQHLIEVALPSSSHSRSARTRPAAKSAPSCATFRPSSSKSTPFFRTSAHFPPIFPSARSTSSTCDARTCRSPAARPPHPPSPPPPSSMHHHRPSSPSPRNLAFTARRRVWKWPCAKPEWSRATSAMPLRPPPFRSAVPRERRRARGCSRSRVSSRLTTRSYTVSSTSSRPTISPSQPRRHLSTQPSARKELSSAPERILTAVPGGAEQTCG